jgi:hypothetical protein
MKRSRMLVIGRPQLREAACSRALAAGGGAKALLMLEQARRARTFAPEGLHCLITFRA